MAGAVVAVGRGAYAEYALAAEDKLSHLPAEVSAVRELGAQRVLDYASDDDLSGQPDYDLIIDAGGLNPIRRLPDALSPRGTLIIVGGEGGSRWTGGIERNLRAAILGLFTRRRLAAFISKDHHSATDRVVRFLSSGAVRPLISHRYPLEQAAEGLADLAAGRIRGKAVVTVRSHA
jgi:NADPH:quinone reductase-like Zn-dependent oxidoreductase